ncbi:MAG: Lrp/AsnC ligand binding domain-containing protein, partial [Reyranella sp.]|nr:Lrp/AsnC ligand binding domain-containing protein [Reyranella sp.]
VGVKIEGHADDRATDFEKQAVAMPEVIACHMIAGEADYLLEVTVPDLDAYQQFLVGRLLNLPLVREVRSNIAIQTLKSGAVLPLGHLAIAPLPTGAVYSAEAGERNMRGRYSAARTPCDVPWAAGAIAFIVPP